MNGNTDYLARRRTPRLLTDRESLNERMDRIVRHFGEEWLDSAGDNPLQRLWKRHDPLATIELLNFGDALAGLERVDAAWLADQVDIVKADDAGNRAGAIFEILGLNVFLFAGNTVVPAKGSNPGYDGRIETPDGSSLLVSIKNHGMTSYRWLFLKNAEELDDQFRSWLAGHSVSGLDLRVLLQNHPDATTWEKMKTDLRDLLDGQIGGTADVQQSKSKAVFVLKPISGFGPLGRCNISSVTFVMGKAHRNEQDKFVEDLRKGCSNLVKHTSNESDDACRVLFVRLCADASIANCRRWANDYFNQFPNERVGLIILYQAAVVRNGSASALTHYILPIEGPQFSAWKNPVGRPSRTLPNMGVLVGSILDEAARKVLVTDDGRQIDVEDAYSYQRGDIYRRHQAKDGVCDADLSNPASGIRIHAEIEDETSAVQMISPPSDGLELLS